MPRGDIFAINGSDDFGELHDLSRGELLRSQRALRRLRLLRRWDFCERRLKHLCVLHFGHVLVRSGECVHELHSGILPAD